MKTLEALKNDWALATEIHKLEARLWRHVVKDDVRVILITSATRGEGKSTTAAYLATAFGQYTDRRVLAMDLDLRSPRLGEYLGITPRQGLGDVLEGGSDWKKAVTPTTLQNLSTLLPSPEGEDASLLLNTPELYRTITESRDTFDLVLIDAPALVPVADASLIIPHVDGVLLVAMAGQTTRPLLENARDLCLGLGARVLGLMVGNMREMRDHSYYYSAYGNLSENGAGRRNGSRSYPDTERPAGREGAGSGRADSEGGTR